MSKKTASPLCRPENVICGEKYRITVLTDGLIRLEYSEDGIFEDRATQVVLYRDFAPVDFTVKESEDELEIFTKRVHLIYNKKEFTSYGLSIHVLGNLSNYDSVWRYGVEPRDMRGTARTLDHVDGACELEHGLLSRFGFSVLDDSKSLILTEDGWVEPRKQGICDIYFWGYGRDYLECLNDFYYLCGKAPMLPRYALGNWWSRYFEYTEDSYRELIEEFNKERVPFSVAVIDMDWHLVKIDPKYGSGWTGYTWNKDFFPDPERFLQWLHEKGMKTTLNVHPADGVRAFEEMYPQMAEAMGIDPETEVPINFDITNKKFKDAYFEILHHPYEDMGVDFWWVDWQQGANSKVPGLDPLWMLNHYHYYDSARGGKRPMTFSRYSGPGSHRYPVGFSGDTHTTWESLEFQPYFTNNASNIGYGWWSHDIGGHMQGYKNEEMATRWLQYGVFSPINRIHSAKDPFYTKEPWSYSPEKRIAIDEFLRVRHQMLPYLYTMNYRSYAENLPLIQPMYYTHPEIEEAYRVPNQYWFGSELLVAPITEPNKAGVNAGSVKAWLPEGTYIDIFTGMIYRGNRMLTMYRDIYTIPVLAKAGAIIPTTDEIFGQDALENPHSLALKVFAGADGAFTLYEDDNETENYKEDICVKTPFTWKWEGEKTFTIHPAEGEISLIPAFRDYTIEICGCTNAGVHVLRNGAETEAQVSYCADKNTLTVVIGNVAASEEVAVCFESEMQLAKNNVEKRMFDFLNRAEISYPAKRKIYDLVCESTDTCILLGQLQAMDLDEALYGCLSEILIA